MAPIIALKKEDQTAVSTESKILEKKVKAEKKANKANKLKKKQADIDAKRGLVYLGHLPHGFFEYEIRSYFKQFGDVTNVRVCRSSNTGMSKGYGYVEFAHPEVAKIAAETMNNYLMFKKRVIAELVPVEKRPKNLFPGKTCSVKSNPKIKRIHRSIALKNRNVKSNNVDKHTNKIVSRLNKRLAKIQNYGISYNLKTVDPTK